jgi:hypothetical protein
MFHRLNCHKAGELKKPHALAGAFFQIGKFLGYYDLTLTATRTWNDNGHFEFHGKINVKKGELLIHLSNFINKMMLKINFWQECIDSKLFPQTV